ncbi:benzoate 4-monooxygenase cytochrome P450 [Cucurbitaria berberidis CBS 394.84]|uniref:Benzoate 4-monooxygenase cytochrome P450 n=1 Tax=Cucurbitaria berberidis CBS 394.84 TaxID=1168544 RepID=A0A9P4GJ57_9PLEO|nr:benzoate 4-monooxygenase cytochrome P450 [Cucurbitaria berberidis CBS 394.84]KAF1846085.1 benzoate 4-monooxygenase cytochrome P450 [Cucurbitaria berberidis CBS 394.84]
MITEVVPVPTVSSAATYAIPGLLVYSVALCLYRVFFHPLAKYPGPLSYKLSGWPLLWQAYTGDRHIWHLKDHEKYGPIVRIAPNTLSFNTASALSTIYGPRSANVKKGEWYKTFDIAAGSYSSFTETEREKHTIKRRWMSPAFSGDSMKANEPLIINIVERFCRTLKPATSGWGAKWNMSEMSTYLGFDIMGALVFGCDFKSVQERRNRDLANSVLPASMLMYWISYLPLAVLVRPLLRTRLFELVGGNSVADNNRLIDYASGQVQARLTRSEVEKNIAEGRIDFLSRLVGVEDKKTGWQPTIEDLGTESLNMINAGADPFSGVLAGAIFYLVHNPEALQKATTEVRDTFASPVEIQSGRDLNECTYLYACIEETLRRTAPVPSHLPRIVLSGGMDIDGEYLPADTVVGVPMYAIHHNPSYFAEPFAFRPERWIESANNSLESIAIARRAFNPFSIGTRQCIGRNLAYLQLKLTLAHLLWGLDMRLAPDGPGCGGGRLGLGVGREREDEFQLWDAFGFGRDGPMVEFKVHNSYEKAE